MSNDVSALGQLFVEITNASKDGFFVIRESLIKSGRHGFALNKMWHAKACRRDGGLVAVRHGTRIRACELLLAALNKEPRAATKEDPRCGSSFSDSRSGPSMSPSKSA